MLNKCLVGFLTIATFITVNAQTIAKCGKTEGYALYHHSGVVKKKDSGFTKDAISDGLNTIICFLNPSNPVFLLSRRTLDLSETY